MKRTFLKQEIIVPCKSCSTLTDNDIRVLCGEGNQLLAKFTIHDETFFIYGTYTLKQAMDLKGCPYSYPEFNDLKAMKEERGIKFLYEPTGVSWHGHRYNATDMLQSCLTACIRADKNFSDVFLEEGLLEFVGIYTNDVALEYGNRRIPRRIFSQDMYSLYELMLVTNLYMYYSADTEDVLMLDCSSGEVISDNFFATVGLDDSLEAIKKGDEEQLWIDALWFPEE